jgi:hypothetical protein
MQEIKFYKATLQSDSGRHYIWLSATDEQSAKMILQTTQSCPLRAITKLVEKTKKQFQNRMKKAYQ